MTFERFANSTESVPEKDDRPRSRVCRLERSKRRGGSRPPKPVLTRRMCSRLVVMASGREPESLVLFVRSSSFKPGRLKRFTGMSELKSLSWALNSAIMHSVEV